MRATERALLTLAATSWLAAGCDTSSTAVRPSPVASPPTVSTPTPQSSAPSLGTPSPSTVSSVQFGFRCSASQLKLGWGGGISEPTGQHTLSLTLTNISRRGCYLFGYPGISLV